MKFFFLLTGFLILFVNVRIWRDLRNPAVVHSLMWSIILLLHYFAPHGLYALSDSVSGIVVASMFIFSLGALSASFVVPIRKGAIQVELLPGLAQAERFFLIIAIVGMPAFLWRAMEMASHGATESFMINLRMALTHEEYRSSYGVLAYLVPVSFAGFFFCISNPSARLRGFVSIVYFAVCLFYALLSTGRTFLFLLFVPSFFILSLTRPNFFSVKRIVGLVAALCAAFFGVGAVMGKLAGEGGGALEVFWIYLLSGLSAFDTVLGGVSQFADGANSLRTIYAIAAAMGVDVEVVELVKDYAEVPVPTNVYTVFYPYYMDFGVWYVLLVQFLFGVGHALFYGFALRGRVWAILIFGFSMYALIMQWFQDQYFSLMTTWIVFIALTFVPYLLGAKSVTGVKKITW